MKPVIAIAMSLLGLVATTSCTPEQVRTIEKVYNVDFSPQQERDLLAAPNIRVTGPTGWVNSDGSVTKYVAPAGSQCPDFFGAAMQAGWAESQWPRLDYIIFRESRCATTAHNPYGRDNSFGLLQLNMKAHTSWVSPLVMGDFSRLWDPVTNLTVGRLLFDKSEAIYGCGWQPWSLRC